MEINLPNEIWLEIFSYGSFRDFMSLRLVSSDFLNLVNESFRFRSVTRMKFQNCDFADNVAPILTFLESDLRIPELKLGKGITIQDHPYHKAIPYFFVKISSWLTVLDLRDVNQPEVYLVLPDLKSFRSLKHLKLHLKSWDECSYFSHFVRGLIQKVNWNPNENIQVLTLDATDTPLVPSFLRKVLLLTPMVVKVHINDTKIQPDRSLWSLFNPESLLERKSSVFAVLSSELVEVCFCWKQENEKVKIFYPKLLSREEEEEESLLSLLI